MSRVGRLFFGRLRSSSLDGLRAVAALAVLLGHMPLLQMPLLPGVWAVDYAKTGVYLFFSLSAFLLTIVLLRSSESPGSRRWVRYAVRRVLRIYPLYLVVLLQAWSVWLRHQIPIYGMTFSDVADHLLLRAGRGIFWTIAVEFKFYFLLPLVIGLIALLRQRVWAVTLALLSAVALSMWLWPAHRYPLNALTLGPYLPIFLLGSLAGFLHFRLADRGGVRSPRVRLALEGVALAAALSLLALNSKLWLGADGRPLPHFTFARAYWLYGVLLAIFLFAQINGTGWIRGLLSLRPLRFLGIISYSIYLLHGSVVVAVRETVDPGTPGRAALAVLLVVGAASLSFLAVERPFLQLGLRLFRRPGNAGGAPAP